MQVMGSADQLVLLLDGQRHLSVKTLSCVVWLLRVWWAQMVKKTNRRPENCITADLRPDTITQAWGLRKAATAATSKSQFPHNVILKILQTPQGAGGRLLLHVPNKNPQQSSTLAQTPCVCVCVWGKVNSVNVVCKKNSKIFKNSVTAGSF